MPPLLWREARAEFAGGEGIQGAEAGGKLDLGQAALAMQPPEKISRGEIVFLAVALVTAGNQVAPGIIPELCKRDDVIQAASCGGNRGSGNKSSGRLLGREWPGAAPGISGSRDCRDRARESGLGHDAESVWGERREPRWGCAPRPRDPLCCVAPGARRGAQ